MARMIEGREKKCTRRRTWLLWYVITFSSAPSHLMWSRRVPFLLWLFPSPQKYYCTSYLIKSVCTYCNLLRICLLIPTFEGARSITRLPHHRRRRKLYSSTPTDKAVRAFVRSSPYLRRTSSQSPPTLHSSDHRSEQAAPNLNLGGGGFFPSSNVRIVYLEGNEVGTTITGWLPRIQHQHWKETIISFPYLNNV